MTLADKLIPQYVRFTWGYSYINLVIAITSFGLNIITVVTVKGIYMPLWILPIIGVTIIIIGGLIGFYFEKKGVINRINSHANQNANPEFLRLCKDVKEIKDRLK